jgi:diguanylate cyclase (GGDEF)-like protein
MILQKIRWGIVPFLLSLGCAGTCFLLLYSFPPVHYGKTYTTVIPVVGIVFSLTSAITAHLSYSRIHSAKTFFFGYTAALAGLGFFCAFRLPQRLGSGISGLILLVAVNLLWLIFIKTAIKYRTITLMTAVTLFAEACAVVCIRFSANALGVLEQIPRNDFLSPATILSLLVAIIILLLSMIKCDRDFSMGGIISGSAVLYYAVWISPILVPSRYVSGAEQLFFTAALLFTQTGILIHWFTKVEHRILYDPLLEIYNRNFCSKIIEEQSKIDTRPPFGIAMVDIDHFKNVNDAHGHQAGDTVLYQVAQTIKKEVHHQGIACRYGGEEIIVFFPRKKTKDVVALMEKMRALIEKTKIPAGRKKISVTVSCGVSQREETSQSIMQIIEAADKALYKAKNGGRNQVKSAR